MYKKVLITITVCLSIILMNENSFAESSKKSKFIRAEGSVLVGFLSSKVWDDPFGPATIKGYFSGAVTMGVFFRNVIGLEASAFFLSGHRNSPGRDAVYSLNATLNVPIKKFSLFATIGIGHRPPSPPGCGDINFNMGGGIKIRLKNKWGIRVEYRTWPGLEEGSLGDSILGGASYFF